MKEDPPQEAKEDRPESGSAKTPGRKKKVVPEVTEIISKFIDEAPSISRPKAEFYNAVNMANLSVTPDEDMVTETLAKIHLKQGNILKAIKIYEKLSLIYPNKMTYFASQIDKIKQENKLS